MSGAEEGRGAEGGFTLIELTVAMALLSVLMTLAFGMTSIFLKVDANAYGQAQATERAASVLSELRMELTSANIVYNPATEASNAGTNPDGTSINAGFSLRIYTQLNGDLVCEQWRLLDNGQLETRSWSDLWQVNGVVLPWTVLASGIENPVGTPPFVLDSGTGYGGLVSSHLVDITLDVEGASTHTSPVVVQTSVAARDAEYYPANTGDCANIPTP